MKLSFSILLICLVSLLIIPSFFAPEFQRLIILLFLTATILIFLNTVKQKRWEMWIGRSMAFLIIMLNLFDFLFQEPSWWGLVLIFNLLFYSFIIFELIRYIVICKVVDNSILSASACVYLLLGLVWCYIYALLDYFFPGSILPVLETNLFENFSRYLYFSLVTLTTLGYGDITPTTRIAQNWVVLEAIVGQLYLTMLVARLVGLYRLEKL
jgi:hypothetical protein